jgi:Membrane proteins related to metalloendopeptidases
MSRRDIGQRIRTMATASWRRLRIAGLVGLSVVLVFLVPSAASADSGWVAPVNAPIWGGFKEPAYHHGVDLGAAKWVPIRAASAGTVIVKKCNASLNGQPYSCDIDGSPQVQGCGWYVDIAHAGNIVTRYCHMVTEPLVNVGDKVETGQRIGYVGSSGNSSAPHLHFEVHIVAEGDYAHNGNAVDPVPFMAKRGAHLGVGKDKPEPPRTSDAEPEPAPPPPPPANGRVDLDGDGRTDRVVWRPSDGQWYASLASGEEAEPVTLGEAGDVPVVADYDGDGRDDLAVWRPSNGQWLILTSSGIPLGDITLGETGDIPVPADYDGDGRVEPAVWRPYSGQWLRHGAETGAEPVVLGEAGDLPVVADYDGDGKADPAVWRPTDGQWIIQPSVAEAELPDVRLGAQGDIPVAGDFDGDGKADPSVWRPNLGVWLLAPSGGEPAEPVAIGRAGDVPVVGDYDGDKKDDLALWRAADGEWLILPSSGERLTAGEPGTGLVFGVEGDLPANRPLWLDTNGQPPGLTETLLRERFRGRQAGAAAAAEPPATE